VISVSGCVHAQVAVPAVPDASQWAPAAVADGLTAPGKHGAKVGLVRGVVKRLDPIHDELWIHVFGGGNVRLAFDPRTQFLVSPENSRSPLTGIQVGSVVSADTVVESGKLFALSVRTGSSQGAELNGQVVRYDLAKSELTLRDPVSPENISLRVTPSTLIGNGGQAVTPQALSPGTLVRVSFSPTQNAASKVEILAEPGSSFTFQGRIVSLDLRSRLLTVFTDSDQSIRDLAIGSLDADSLRLLREGADVSVQAEFDGDRYNVRAISLVSRNP